MQQRNMRTFNRRLAATALLSVKAISLTDAQQSASLVDLRHHPPDLDMTAELRFPQYAESALMVSPCQPAEDGYFGGTSGKPVYFDYFFEMESSPTAALQKSLGQIRDGIMDDVVSDTFPQLCGLRRSLQYVETAGSERNSLISGFRFGKTPTMDLSKSCEPLLGEHNYCAYYKSRIAVYGHNLFTDDAVPHIMKTVLDSVGAAITKVAPTGVMRLVPSEKYTTIIDAPDDFHDGGLIGSPTGSSLSSLSILVLIVASLTLITGIVGLVVFMHMDSKERREPSKTLDTGAKRKGCLSLLCYRLFTTGDRTHADETYSQSEYVDNIYLTDGDVRADRNVLLHVDAGLDSSEHRSLNFSRRDYVMD